jgi:hypothetical protein
MMINLDDVDLGFVVNLSTLREVLADLSANGCKWWIASDPADALATRSITIGHGDPGCVDRLNTLYYRVPVLTEDSPTAGPDTWCYCCTHRSSGPSSLGSIWSVAA